MKDAQVHFGFNGRQLNRVLTLYKKSYISRRKINKVKFSYNLNDKYKKLLNKLKDKINEIPTLDNPIYQ